MHESSLFLHPSEKSIFVDYFPTVMYAMYFIHIDNFPKQMDDEYVLTPTVYLFVYNTLDVTLDFSMRISLLVMEIRYQQYIDDERQIIFQLYHSFDAMLQFLLLTDH